MAFEITARARFFVFGNTRKRRPSVSARSRGSSKRRWIRQRFRVCCGIPFEIPFGIALLRTLHCFELCFARLHRHRQVPYANLVYIYLYILYCNSSARIGGWKRGFCRPQPSKTPHRACFALEIIARPCSAATSHSKSLLRRAAKPLGARNHRSNTTFRIRQHSQTPPQR